MLSRISKTRFVLINIAILSVFPLLVYQMVRLSILTRPYLLDYAKRQQNLVIEIEPERGAILDRNGRELATDLDLPSAYAVPRLISPSEREKLVPKLGEILDLDPTFLENRLSRNKAFVWLKRRMSVRERDRIRRLNNPNLGIAYEPKRFYPHGSMLSNVMGFCNIDNLGVEGLELLHQKKLSGRVGYRYTKRDGYQREMVALQEKTIPAVNSSRLILTINQYIQYVTEEALDRAYREYRAEGAV